MPAILFPAKVVFSQEGSVDFKRLLVQGITPLMTSVNLADRVTKRLLRAWRKTHRRGDIRAIQELLYINPEFVRFPWVHKMRERLRRLERVQRRRGRPKGIYTIDPRIVLGFVFALRASGKLKNNHRALCLLGRWGILSYDRARRLYRAARKDSRLLPLLLPRRKEARPFSMEKYEALKKRAVEFADGTTLFFKLKNDAVKNEAILVNVIHEEK